MQKFSRIQYEKSKIVSIRLWSVTKILFKTQIVNIYNI